jgi:hypothetical protein
MLGLFGRWSYLDGRSPCDAKTSKIRRMKSLVFWHFTVLAGRGSCPVTFLLCYTREGIVQRQDTNVKHAYEIGRSFSDERKIILWQGVRSKRGRKTLNDTRFTYVSMQNYHSQWHSESGFSRPSLTFDLDSDGLQNHHENTSKIHLREEWEKCLIQVNILGGQISRLS